MQEYSMIMSERDSVHKEIEKLQDEVSNTNSKMKEVESKTKIHDDEKRKLVCQIEVCSLFFIIIIIIVIFCYRTAFFILFAFSCSVGR